MKQKNILLFTVATIFLSLIGIMPTTAEDTTIQLGDYVQMGTYDKNADGIAEPILWRCVAFEKVIGIDANGNPITDSTQNSWTYRDGYLPLMLAHNAICTKIFDAAGTDTSGSHGRCKTRATNGSNYWADSNIRDWLNSSAAAGKVAWSCGNPPPYSAEAGFLTNFSNVEKSAIKTVTQKSILAAVDKDIAGVTGAAAYTYTNEISEIVQNYKEAYSEQVTDTMFLMDVQQVKNVYDNLQEYYIPTMSTLRYWLRTPIATHDYLVRQIFSSGEVFLYPALSSGVEVRPAFYFNPSSVLYGNGSQETPYTLTASHIYDMSVDYKKDNGELGIYDCDYSIKYENEKLVVTVPRDDTYTVIFAVRDAQGKLHSMIAQTVSLIKGVNEWTAPQNFEGDQSVKVMLWDSLNGMRPLCAAGRN